MKKLAILGASYLQVPLMQKARELSIETHVFSQGDGSFNKGICDHFYPISTTDKDQLLKKCQEIRIDGIISIGSDVAMPAVNHVAEHMGLIGNTAECTFATTNKYEMRQRLSAYNLPCPRFEKVTSASYQIPDDFPSPCIIKPTDRSGSRGVTKTRTGEDIVTALQKAISESFDNEAIIEEFIEGKEISVEMISWQGKHYYITCTDKVSTGEPYFVETEQHVPANLSPIVESRIIDLVKKGLTVLGVEYGASHSEILMTNDEEIFIVEIGARMGGDNIGSDLVCLGTGYDYLKGVIEIALGDFNTPRITHRKHAGIFYLTPKEGVVTRIMDNSDGIKEVVRSTVFVNLNDIITSPVTDSSQRSGYFIYESNKRGFMIPEHVINIITE